MIDDNEIKKQLHSPAPPDDLEKDIRNAWRDLPENKQNRILIHWKLYAFASVAGLLMIATILNYSTMTPSIVSSAIADIQKDEFMGVELTEKYRPWLIQKKINLPPAEMKVEISKFCKLSNQLSFHLKLAGEHRGKVHLFFLKNKPQIPVGKSSGQVASMSWRIIQPRNNIYVLVMFTKDMRKESVNKLINNMFYV